MRIELGTVSKRLNKMSQQNDFTRLYALTDEMGFDANNHALDAKALRARLRHYRSKINRELAAIVIANTKIE
jgi:hypothetical protein